MRRELTLVALASVGAFGGACSSAPVEHAASRPPRASAGAPSSEAPTFACQAIEGDPATVHERDLAIDELLGGHRWRASNRLEKLLAAHPTSLAVYALHATAVAELEKNRKLNLVTLRKNPIRVDDIPTARRNVATVALKTTPTLDLQLVSSSKFGPSDDNTAWLNQYGFVFPGSAAHMDLRPELRQGSPFSKELTFDDHRLSFFGDTSVAIVPSEGDPWLIEFTSLFDYGKRPQPAPRFPLTWGQVVGETLIVQIGEIDEQSPLPSSFLGAIDARTGKTLWWSEPHVANAQSFVIAGSHAIVGFGSREKASVLSVIDLTDGKVESTKPLPDDPTWLFARGENLFVRGLATDSVFQVKGLVAPMPADIDGKPKAPPERDLDADRVACALRRASAMLDKRDGAAAIREIDALAPDDARLSALAAAADFVVHHDDPQKPSIDLTTSKPFVVNGFPFRATSRPDVRPKGEQTWRLVLKDSFRVKSLEKRRPGVQIVELDGPLPGAPQVFTIPGVAFPVPASFGVSALSRTISQGPDAMLFYGDHLLSLLRDRKPVGVFDLEALTRGPGVDAHPGEPTTQVVLHAAANDKLLFVASGRPGSTSAKDLGGKKNYLSAIDLSTGALAWQSEPLVCNLPFALGGEVIVSATTSPNALVLVSATTGDVISRTPLRVTPIGVAGYGDEFSLFSPEGIDRYTLRH